MGYTGSLAANASSKGGVEILLNIYASERAVILCRVGCTAHWNAWMRLHQLVRPIAAVLSKCLVF